MFYRIQKRETTYKLFIFLLLYINIWLTFTFIYFLLDMINVGPVVDHYASPAHQASGLDRITRSLYLSSITLLSVGYGDVTPFGWSRAVATVQALIGYLLPVVIVIQFISPNRNVIRRKNLDRR
ncbi:two pore domain potassium channel family protein [Alkalihalobacillus sp. BA299]|uniref:two pore domain potassium channel family protein n=1 Tax=Alkalihalobacillus sp. BA299 TaxID=2815938 RepID=UPI001ADB77E8|nr:two pore domain potassium channel family protein [Alkalihalobacillus sp. BA299]